MNQEIEHSVPTTADDDSSVTLPRLLLLIGIAIIGLLIVFGISTKTPPESAEPNTGVFGTSEDAESKVVVAASAPEQIIAVPPEVLQGQRGANAEVEAEIKAGAAFAVNGDSNLTIGKPPGEYESWDAYLTEPLVTITSSIDDLTRGESTVAILYREIAAQLRREQLEFALAAVQLRREQIVADETARLAGLTSPISPPLRGGGGGSPAADAPAAPAAAQRRFDDVLTRLAAAQRSGDDAQAQASASELMALLQSGGGGGNGRVAFSGIGGQEETNDTPDPDTFACRQRLPESRLCLRRGSVIPYVLQTAIDSQLPGQVLGVVSQNVRDSLRGKNILIPQGTKLVGVVDSENIGYRQDRVQVRWDYLVLPDGRNLRIRNPALSADGSAGQHDTVDNHYIELVGGTTILGLISYFLQKVTGAENEESTDDESASEAIAANYAGLAETVVERTLDVPPVIKIRAGRRGNILLADFDMIFPFAWSTQ